jgi:hypothetical protein
MQYEAKEVCRYLRFYMSCNVILLIEGHSGVFELVMLSPSTWSSKVCNWWLLASHSGCGFWNFRAAPSPSSVCLPHPLRSP